MALHWAGHSSGHTLRNADASGPSETSCHSPLQLNHQAWASVSYKESTAALRGIPISVLSRPGIGKPFL